MKMFKKIFLTFVGMCICLTVAHAAPSQSFYTSANSIESGTKVTATLQLKNVAAWNVKIVSNGSTSGCDQSFADATGNGGNTTKYLSVTCNSTGVGQISFRVTGDATSSDGSTVSISGVKVVTVKTPRAKDTNNYLSSIGVEGYELNTPFDKETLEYSVNVPSTVDKVVLKATKASNYATLTGIGEVEVNEGINTFEIKVVSETGVERVYKLVINVEDENPITVDIQGNKYTIMKNGKTLEAPATFSSTTIKINDFDIPAFYSEVSNFTLVGVKDSKGTTHFAIYDKDNSTYQLYREIKSNQMLMYIKNIKEELEGFKKERMTIHEVSYDVMVCVVDPSVIVVSAMNIVTGKDDYYIYDKENDTYTKYNDSIAHNLNDEISHYKEIILYFAGGLLVSFVIILILLFSRPKSKKNKKKKEETDVVKSVKLEKNDPSLDKESKDKPKKNKKDKLKSKEDALKEVSEAASIIEEYEKTIQLSKKDIAKKKKEMESSSDTMYNIFEDDKKRKKH